MTNRERILAILNYQPYDRLPILHFGHWGETLQKWAAEGHLTDAEARGCGDGNPIDAIIGEKLGFDANYYSCFHPNGGIRPPFESRVVQKNANRHSPPNRN